MYKLAIVEDERDVRSRLVSLIRRAGSNFEIISEYETGIDAYDGIISDNPDLLITDIKIPYINGIELVKRLREELPLLKVIIVTGYSEFDYAKEAANLGVVGFISKPITLEDIRLLLSKAESALDEQYFTASSLSRFESFYESSLPILKENDLNRLSKMSDVPAPFESKLQYNGININYKYFVVSLFDFDDTQEGGSEQYDVKLSSVRKFVGEEFDGIYDYELFNRYEKLCLIVKSDTQPEIKKLEIMLSRIIQRVGRYSDMPLSAGVSNIHMNSRNFALMTRQATRALEYRRVIGGRKVFFFADISSPTFKISVDDDTIKEIGYSIHFGSAADSTARIDSVRRQLESSEESNYYVATGILNILIKACDDPEGLYSRFGGPGSLYRRFFEIKTDDEVFEFLKELVHIIRELNNNVIVDNVDRNLQKINAYMQAHYCDADISFETVSKGVSFSISYISALLKKNLNTSFVKLLTGMRMEKAKELLADPSLKIIDVAEKLGYNDSYYFSHCFKKYTGMSPKEYRNNENRK